MEPWDVTIVGGGILGTSFAYWLANRYDGRIALLEKESQVAMHTSRRNTGVVHRPFYLDPVGRKVFARSAQTAYGMWKVFAAERGLPWLPVGTFEVAVRPDQVSRLEKYRDWGLANGMGEDELALLTAEDVRRLEPNVRSHGAIWSKTDTAVDYQVFTQALREDAERAGAKFLLGSNVESVTALDDHLEIRLALETASDRVYVDSRERIRVRANQSDEPLGTRFLINAAGGHSIDIAHALGVGLEYTDLHFRGEYWEVGPEWHDVKEAIEIPGRHSFHVLNYNSPGATGSPAYTAWIVNLLANAGHLDHLKAKAARPDGLWDFDTVCAAIEAPTGTA